MLPVTLTPNALSKFSLDNFAEFREKLNKFATFVNELKTDVENALEEAAELDDGEESEIVYEDYENIFASLEEFEEDLERLKDSMGDKAFNLPKQKGDDGDDDDTPL